MSNYKPTTRHCREVILYYFNSNQLAAEAYRMLLYAYGKDTISQTTCYKWYTSFEKGDFNLDKCTRKPLNNELVIEELVRLRLEDSGITLAQMASKVGLSIKTVHRHVNSQEFKNKFNEKKQQQSSAPLEFTTPRQVRSERLIEQLVRLRLEDPNITRAAMAEKVGKSIRTVSRYVNSQEYQKKLEKKIQEQSSLPLERTTLKRKHEELEDEKLVHLIHENPRMSQDELAKQLEISLPTASKGVNIQEIQNKLKEKVLEPSSIPKKRRISRTPSTESEDEELEHFIDEFPGVTPDEIAQLHRISIFEDESLIDFSVTENK